MEKDSDIEGTTETSEEASEEGAKKKPGFTPEQKKALFRNILGTALIVATMATGFFGAWYAVNLQRWGLKTVYGTRIFYDQYHVNRHFIDGQNVRGEWAYHVVSGYYDFRRTLERAGYDVHVHKRGPIRPGMLDGFDIFFIGEQTPKGKLMQDDERKVIFDYIEGGGNMWATVEHTNAHGMGELFNKFMEGTDIAARYDSICEENGTTDSKDWVAIENFKDHPVTEGLEAIYFFNGCSLDTPHGVAFSSEKSWSDGWNPDDQPVGNGDNIKSPDELAGPLPALAAREFGEGKIAVTCDHNPFSNPSLHMGSNRELLLNAMKWFSEPKLNKAVYYLAGLFLIAIGLFFVTRRVRAFPLWILLLGLVVGGAAGAFGDQRYNENEYRILFAEINDPTTSARSKDRDGIWGLFQHGLKTDVSLWLKTELSEGYDDLAIVAPTGPLSEEQLGVVDEYLRDGKSVIYFATEASLRSKAGAQLAEKMGFEFEFGSKNRRGSRSIRYELAGDGRLKGGVEELAISRDVSPGTISGDGWTVRNRAVDDDVKLDLVAEKQSGLGRYVFVQTDVYDNLHRRMNEKLDFVDVVMNLIEWIEAT